MCSSQIHIPLNGWNAAVNQHDSRVTQVMGLKQANTQNDSHSNRRKIKTLYFFKHFWEAKMVQCHQNLCEHAKPDIKIIISQSYKDFTWHLRKHSKAFAQAGNASVISLY